MLTLQAAFIRQMLQLIVASPQLSKLSSKSRTLDLPMMRAFTGLLLALFSASTYVSCQPNFIEPLIGLYRGTLDISDRNILSIMQLFEQNRKISVVSVMRLWSPDPSSAASATQRSLDVVKALDAQKVFATCTSFPLRRGFVSQHRSITNDDASLYDPVAVLSITLAMLHEGSITGLDWVEILRSNILGLAICALSSRVSEVRSVAGFVLAKALLVIEVSSIAFSWAAADSRFRQLPFRKDLKWLKLCVYFATQSRFQPKRASALACQVCQLSSLHMPCAALRILHTSSTLWLAGSYCRGPSSIFKTSLSSTVCSMLEAKDGRRNEDGLYACFAMALEVKQ